MPLDPGNRPPPKLNTDLFHDHPQGLLTPMSIDQGYYTATSPMTAATTFSLPLCSVFGPTDPFTFEPPHQPENQPQPQPQPQSQATSLDLRRDELLQVCSQQRPVFATEC